MRAIPISDAIAELLGGERTVIGEPGDPTRDDVRPCEYLLTESTLYPGRPAVTAIVELDDEDRELLADGAKLFLRMDGGELPWEIGIVHEATGS